jgi:AhpD family alkylhydroperoxidase
MIDNIYTEFRKLSPKVTGGLVRMRQETFRDAAVAAKYKILAALTIVVVTKCEPCIRAYTKMAYQAGVTQEELLEFLNVAMTEGGCPGEQWASRAYQVYKELKAGKTFEEDACCTLD